MGESLMADGGNVTPIRGGRRAGRPETNGHARPDSIDLGALDGFDPPAPGRQQRARKGHQQAPEPGEVSPELAAERAAVLRDIQAKADHLRGVFDGVIDFRKTDPVALIAEQMFAEHARQYARQRVEIEQHPTRAMDRFEPGGSFIFDDAELDVPVWGTGVMILHAAGEALLIAAGQGAGKTTIGQQLALGRAGLDGFDTLLGFPIVPGKRRVLYLAMDRPSQARRSIRRMVTERQQAELDERLVIWKGPPPADLAGDPELLLAMCTEADADTVVVDSIKDAALKLSDDAVGAGWNRARQNVLTAGIEMVELHHLRKVAGGGETPREIDDLYGSTWITSGTGSVLHLAGKPGDAFVRMRHLKQPAEEVGPLLIRHDHARGRTTVADDGPDLWSIVRNAPAGITAKTAATLLRSDDDESPISRNEIEKARRQLDRLAEKGMLRVEPGDKTAAEIDDRATRWFVVERGAEGVDSDAG